MAKRAIIPIKRKQMGYVSWSGCVQTVGMIRDMSESDHKIDQSVESTILSLVCETAKVSPTEIQGLKGNRNAITHRQWFFYLLYIFSNMSLEKVGSYCGKDHATVIHAIKVTRGRAETSLADNLLWKYYVNQIHRRGLDLNPERMEYYDLRPIFK